MSACILWDRGRNGAGYGWLRVNGVGWLTHRYVYTVERGPIPPGMHIDHLCSVRLCVNIEHLEAVTQGTNNRRAAARRTTCKRGHPLDGSYTRRDGRRTRRCLTCHREEMRRGR